MKQDRARGRWLAIFVWLNAAVSPAYSQCPQFSNYNVSGVPTQCGSTITISQEGANIPAGSSVDWYIGMGTNFNPYNGEGMQIGSVPVTTEMCNNIPEVLYIMVNPDNNQVGGPGDECDEFLVLWTGSGGFMMNDILITNLGPGTSVWDDFAPGNGSTFSCGVPLPPGPIPENAILIIQSSPNNNVSVNSDALCASGLPVYIITYTGTMSCMFGYFDNNSPCSSCPVNIAINGTDCDFNISANYTPPGSSVDGWAWANTGAGVYANVIPPLDFPVFDPPANTIPDFVWTVPADFCTTFGPGDWNLQGILNPPPVGGCPEIASPYFGVNISCPELILSGGGEVCENNCPDNPALIGFQIIGNDVP
ncbi:MAG TPA: hypothetical protein VJ508_17675, partial [Saprospiraceae bacterium]|nr:hypothetical protein [Saprospiraceae bacterium]